MGQADLLGVSRQALAASALAVQPPAIGDLPCDFSFKLMEEQVGRHV